MASFLKACFYDPKNQFLLQLSCPSAAQHHLKQQQNLLAQDRLYPGQGSRCFSSPSCCSGKGHEARGGNLALKEPKERLQRSMG